MANFIIGTIVDKAGEVFGYRVSNCQDKVFRDLSVAEILEMMSDDDDSFSGSYGEIVNAEKNGSDIVVVGYEENPVTIDQDGKLKSNAEYTLCGFNPIIEEFIVAKYDGAIEFLSITAIDEKVAKVGANKISNLEIVDAVKKEKEKEGPQSVYIGENKIVDIPAGYEDNDLVKTLYGKVNENPKNVIGAYVLHTKTKTEKQILRHHEFNDDGVDIGQNDVMDFDIDNSIVNTFVILELVSKRFISLPVCKAFEPLIKAFKYKDMPVDKFTDFLDFLAEGALDVDMLELEDEKTISNIIGGNITAVTIDNTCNITYEIENGQPVLYEERMDATFTVEITEKKKSKDLTVYSLQWTIY